MFVGNYFLFGLQQTYLHPRFPPKDSSKAKTLKRLKSIDNDRPCSCCYFTWACTPRGKYEDGEHLYRRVMEIKEAKLGKDHPEYSTNLNNLAGLLEKHVGISVYRYTLGAYLAGIDLLPPCCSIRAVR